MERGQQPPGHLVERIRQGRHPSALILAGQRRDALSRWLSMAYLCEARDVPCGLCAHCRKVGLSLHPDCITVGTEGETLKVDTLRAMRRDVSIRPNEAARKVYRILADGINLAGQNVLLKLLEEGPAYAAFFLECSSPDALLLTVRSRCETVYAPGGEGEPAGDEQCKAFAALLAEEAPGLRLFEFLVPLEKRKREEIRALLDGTRDVLLPQAAKNEALLPTLEALGKVRAACETNISPGHLVGMLMQII